MMEVSQQIHALFRPYDGKPAKRPCSQIKVSYKTLLIFRKLCLLYTHDRNRLCLCAVHLEYLSVIHFKMRTEDRMSFHNRVKDLKEFILLRLGMYRKHDRDIIDHLRRPLHTFIIDSHLGIGKRRLRDLFPRLCRAFNRSLAFALCKKFCEDTVFETFCRCLRKKDTIRHIDPETL